MNKCTSNCGSCNGPDYSKLFEHLSIPAPSEWENHGFYCSICDSNSVEPNGNGGRWFAAHGHLIKNDGTSGRYEAVRFAVCNNCLGL